MILWLFDLLLALALVGLAWRILATSDLFQAIILFIVFGLLMAVAWSRLQAFDIALAEAAIGAGLTGALLLNTLARMEKSPAKPTSNQRQTGFLTGSIVTTGVMGLLTLMVGATLLRCITEIKRPERGVRELVMEELSASGVSNPVTAVLLNFRGYDTLLEMAVLLVAVVGAWSLGPIPRSELPLSAPGRILLGMVRLFSPIILVVAGYILWAGTGQPGGAFQAGAVLSAAGVLLVVAGVLSPPTLRPLYQRALLLSGLVTFVSVSLGVMLAGRDFMEYPPAASAKLILLIESALTVSIAVTLLCLFVGGPRQTPDSSRNEPIQSH